jgi:hypothetical protein
MAKSKFKFTTDLQYDILKYTILDSNGYKALEMYDDTYFTLLEHSLIAFTLKRYYKRKKVIPGKTIFIQELIKTFEHRDFINSITPLDRDNVLKLGNDLFIGSIQDGDEILSYVEKFAQYVDLKSVIENIDLLDYNQYEPFSRKVQKAISPRIQALTERGSFLSKDVLDRQVRRRDISPVVKFPFSSLNKLTNAGGYARGSIFVVLDKAKKFKTGMLVNIARGYFKTGKNVLVIDLDNGEDEFMIRVEQSLTGLTKREVISGKYDGLITKKLSNKKNEIIIKKMPSLVTTANDVQSYIQYLYREFGIKIQTLVIDYISKMGCISGKDSLHERISEAYIDISNLALAMDIDHIWTAQHVNRDAAKHRMSTRYDSTDIAGSIDISRHVQAIFGLNRSVDEENNGYQRMEIVDQRDGKPRGRAIFKVDRDKQFIKQLSHDEQDEYYEIYKEHLRRIDVMNIDDEDENKPKKVKGYPSFEKKNDLQEE